MVNCVICNHTEPGVYQQKEAVPVPQQKEIFQVFCKLLGIPEQEIETFAIDYDVENHSPFCNACAHYPLDLSKNEDSQTRIEDEVLALQIAICSKLRELSERKIEGDEIVRQIQKRMKNQEPVDIGRESYVGRKICGASFRNRISKLTQLSNRSGIGNISIPNTVIAANPIEEYPENFVVPNDITKIVVMKVEIKDESIDYADDEAFDAMEEAIEDLAGQSQSPIPGDNNEDMICSYEEDFNYSIGIDPMSVKSESQHSDSDENEQGIRGHNSLNSVEDIPEKTVSKYSRSKRGTGSKKKRKVKKKVTPTPDTDDSVSEKIRIMPKRKSAIVSKRKQKSQLRKLDSDISDYSDCDKNDSVDEDWVDKEELKRLQGKVYKEPKAPGEYQLQLIKYLGEIDKSEDGKLTFRDIEVIEREVNKLECGQCGFISAQTSSYPNSILHVSVRMRKHIMETHLGGYTCLFCSKPPVKDFRPQLNHMRAKHSTVGPGIECEICAKPYKYISEAYRFHLFTHKSEEEKEEAIRSGVKMPSYSLQKKFVRKFQCKDCEKSYIFEKQLICHMESHRDKNERDKERVPCYVCGKLQYPNFIKIHERSHQRKREPPQRHPCKFCPRRFGRPFQLALHVRRSHTGERPFACQTCSRSFYCASDLKLHTVSHSTERAFPCPLCSATYKSKDSLERHKKTSHQTHKAVCV